MIHRILLVIAYDGTNYNGFALQKDESLVTVEGTLNQALRQLTGEDIRVIGASRTDSGVHAYCNYVVFDTQSRIPPDKFADALNTKLPKDIRVRKSRATEPDFHPRNAQTVKTYEYRIYNARVPDPIRRNYCCYTHFHLNCERMREAAKYLVGEHDFKSFCNPATAAATTVREVVSIEIEEKSCGLPSIMLTKNHTIAQQDEAREITIRIQGKGFLYNMVRIIAGTLIDVGRGNREPYQVKEMLDARDRQRAGPTAPACGLFLTDYRFIH